VVKNHQHPRSPLRAKTAALVFSATNDFFANTQQDVKLALHAVILNSLLAAMLAAVKTPL